MSDLRDIQARYRQLGFALPQPMADQALRSTGYLPGGGTESGRRATPENATRYLYRSMWTDPDLRACIHDIRDMDRKDPRVKKIHGRMSRAAVKGGLQLRAPMGAKRIQRLWDQYVRRLGLHRREKLESDARGLIMEGNLPLQWVLDRQNRVANGVRMPTETMVPLVGPNGRFHDPRRAYKQYDLSSGQQLAVFPLWSLSLVRLTPENHDDYGSMGRPYLDSARKTWRQLTMTEEDLVIRRRSRAPQRKVHTLEGASKEELEEYRAGIEKEQMEGNVTDYYMNRKGSVTALEGDANLDQIADVGHLLDTFFSGAPAPKGLFGYASDLQRDILEDLKQDFYDELDALQDSLAFAYELGFSLELLLNGINPEEADVRVVFAERRTETANQAADRALKYQALGTPTTTVWETAGLDPEEQLERREAERKSGDPYPDPSGIGEESGGGGTDVSVTPGNRRKGESATDVSVRS